MSNAIERAGEFLKCDADGCDHIETVPVVSEGLIGKPCPKCGADLLTREDYDGHTAIIASIKILNDALPSSGDEAERVPLRVNPHAGKINIEIG